MILAQEVWIMTTSGCGLDALCSKDMCVDPPEVVSIAVEALLSLCPPLLWLNHLQTAQHSTA
jgi:hypothetical protein